jgi:hypothetical protein
LWKPLTDVQIDIRTAAAWRSANRSPLLRALVDQLPAAAADHAKTATLGEGQRV